MSLVIGCLMLVFCGGQFSLGAWTQELRVVVGFSTLTFEDVELLATLLNTGTYGGCFLSSIVYRAIPQRVAPVVVCAIALGLYGLSTTLVYLAAARVIVIPGVGIAFLFLCLGLGSSAIITVALAINTPLFPNHRGKVVGLLTSCMAFGGVVFSAAARGFVTGISSDGILHFLIMFEVFGLSVAVLGMLTQRPSAPPPPSATRTPLAPLARGSVVMELAVDPDVEHAPMGSRRSRVASAKYSAQLVAALRSQNQSLVPAMVDISGLALFRDGRFYVLWTAFFVSCGVALTLGNNIQQMMLSAQLTTDPAIMLTVFNVCSIVGRLAIGIIADAAIKRVARFFWMVMALSAMFVVMAVHTAVPSGIYGSTPVVGLMFGVSMATTLTIIPDWFGLVSAATNNGIFLIGVAAGSLTLGNLTSVLYLPHVQPGTHTCVGEQCFMGGLLLMSALLLLSLAMGLLLLTCRGARARAKCPSVLCWKCCHVGLTEDFDVHTGTLRSRLLEDDVASWKSAAAARPRLATVALSSGDGAAHSDQENGGANERL